MTEPANLPLSKAFLWIIVSVLLVSGTSGLGLMYYQHIKERHRQDSAFKIVAIVQTSPESEGLKTVYLSELLGLSVDQPKNLYSFNANEALERVLNSPLIKEATIRKIRPGTIHIDYTMRKPIAFLGDYTNAAIDKDGIPFPVKPFFTPKKLPDIYLGSIDDNIDNSCGLVWGKQIKGKRLDLAFHILKMLQRKCCDGTSSVRQIDVSRAFALSCGQRQIVVTLEERSVKKVENKPVFVVSMRILRLTPENYPQQLANYLQLKPYLNEQDKKSLSAVTEGSIHLKPTIIDMRLSDLAFITP
jgi:hypothetical protein